MSDDDEVYEAADSEAFCENTYDSNIFLHPRKGAHHGEDECDKYFDFSNATSDYDEEFEDEMDSFAPSISPSNFMGPKIDQYQNSPRCFGD